MSDPHDDLDRRFARDGFVSLPGLVGAEGLAEIHVELARFRADVVPKLPPAEVYFEDRDDPTTLKQVQQLWKHDAFFHDLMVEGRFAQIAAQLLGEPIRPWNMQLFDKPTTRSTPTPPHQDGRYFPIRPNHAVTLWLALDDVDVDQGCIRYVRGSHRHGLRPHAPSGTLGFSQGITDFGSAHDRAHEVACPCRAGHLNAHHSLTIHRAEANQRSDRGRRALGFIYFAARAVVDEHADRAYQAKLAADLGKAGRI